MKRRLSRETIAEILAACFIVVFFLGTICVGVYYADNFVHAEENVYVREETKTITVTNAIDGYDGYHVSFHYTWDSYKGYTLDGRDVFVKLSPFLNQSRRAKLYFRLLDDGTWECYDADILK